MFAGVLLLVVVMIYRVALSFVGGTAVAGMHNFSPMGALVLCSAAFFPRRWALTLPFVGLLISDIILNAHYGVSIFDWETIPQFLAFGCVAALGWKLRGRPPGWRIFGASLAGSLIFYVVTNTGSWALKPEYASGFGGWLQALTTGTPGYAPTWLFFRNTLVSDLVFTALFVACLGYRTSAPAPVREPAIVSA